MELKNLAATIIGVTDFRNANVQFGIKDADRLHHIYCLGKTGMGKSTLLARMACSDISRGNGLGLLDPHGDLAALLLHHVPASRKGDLIYVDCADPACIFSYNPLECPDRTRRHLVASQLLIAFKALWLDSWGPRLEYLLRYCLLTLMEYPGSTLLDVAPLLLDPIFRRNVLSIVTPPQLQMFWRTEYEKYAPGFRMEAISPILNKLGVLNANAVLRRIFGRTTNAIDLREMMDGKKVFIANLSKGDIGEDAASLIGSLVVSGFHLAATERASVEPDKRVPFYLYVDEAHSFLSSAIPEVLSGARKFGLSLFLTNQYLGQLTNEVRSAIFGNVGTLITFRVGAEDAEALSKEFSQAFSKDDLLSIPPYSIYLKMTIDGVMSRPFSAKTLAL